MQSEFSQGVADTTQDKCMKWGETRSCLGRFPIQYVTFFLDFDTHKPLYSFFVFTWLAVCIQMRSLSVKNWFLDSTVVQLSLPSSGILILISHLEILSPSEAIQWCMTHFRISEPPYHDRVLPNTSAKKSNCCLLNCVPPTIPGVVTRRELNFWLILPPSHDPVKHKLQLI